MTRLDDMLGRYGECVTVASAERIIGRCRSTINQMLKDGRLKSACQGTMVDVRSICEYIEAPETADTKARHEKMVAKGRSRFHV